MCDQNSCILEPLWENTSCRFLQTLFLIDRLFNYLIYCVIKQTQGQNILFLVVVVDIHQTIIGNVCFSLMVQPAQWHINFKTFEVQDKLPLDSWLLDLRSMSNLNFYFFFTHPTNSTHKPDVNSPHPELWLHCRASTGGMCRYHWVQTHVWDR